MGPDPDGGLSDSCPVMTKPLLSKVSGISSNAPAFITLSAPPRKLPPPRDVSLIKISERGLPIG